MSFCIPTSNKKGWPHTAKSTAISGVGGTSRYIVVLASWTFYSHCLVIKDAIIIVILGRRWDVYIFIVGQERNLYQWIFPSIGPNCFTSWQYFTLDGPCFTFTTPAGQIQQQEDRGPRHPTKIVPTTVRGGKSFWVWKTFTCEYVVLRLSSSLFRCPRSSKGIRFSV